MLSKLLAIFNAVVANGMPCMLTIMAIAIPRGLAIVVSLSALFSVFIFEFESVKSSIVVVVVVVVVSSDFLGINTRILLAPTAPPEIFIKKYFYVNINTRQFIEMCKFKKRYRTICTKRVSLELSLSLSL